MNDFSDNRGTFVYKQKTTNFKRIIAFSITIVMISIFVWMVIGRQKESTQPNQPAQIPPQKTKVAEAPTKPQLPNLQPIVDKFIDGHEGTYSIKITDDHGNSLAEVDGEQQFFTSSIYKLYVAYVGYQKIDDETYSIDDPYLSGYTRGECLDAMIRESNNPCAETMLDELGKEELTNKMASLGLTKTSLAGFVTSANDTSIILQKIATGDGLSKASQQAFLDSMKTQDAKYRLGLPSGFKTATVYNKVGWNLDQEWHDTAIVELPSGQKVIISVLSTGAGYQNIALLGTTLERALK